MNLAFTDAFVVDTSGVTIQLGATPGGGVIPDWIRVHSISVWPTSASQTYQVKGIHADSAWSNIRAGEIFTIENLGGNPTKELMRVRASTGSFQINLAIKGD
jgi:hypothetical protein